MKDKYDVKFNKDFSEDSHFLVTKPDGEVFKFIESNDELYYVDTAGHEKGFTLVNTVDNNISKYTSKEYLRAKSARELQIMIGRPSTRDFIKIVSSNQLPN